MTSNPKFNRTQSVETSDTLPQHLLTLTTSYTLVCDNRVLVISWIVFLQAENGGLVSPGGLSYIGSSKEHLGEIPAAIACKRLHLDEAIAMAAKR